MQKGVSIFFEMHEQGLPHVIAGIYSPQMKTEEEMRTALIGLMGYNPFDERYQPTFVNHTHVYANSLLGNDIDKDLQYILSRFFPQALEPESLPADPFKFEHRDGGAYEFICNNRYSKQLHTHRLELQHHAAAQYKAKCQSESVDSK